MVQALMEGVKANPDPEVKQRARQVLEAMRESSEPERRRLDNAPGPFHSNPPETVENSIQLPNVTRPEFVPPKPTPDLLRHMQKAGTTEHLLEKVKNPTARKLQAIPPNSLGCLSSVIDSIITSKAVSVYVNGELLSEQEEVSISSKVKNECPKDVDNIQFHAKATGECNVASGVETWDYQATPPLLHPTETVDGGSADMQPKVSRCEIRKSKNILLAVYRPRSLVVELTADGIMRDEKKNCPVRAKFSLKKKLI